MSEERCETCKFWKDAEPDQPAEPNALLLSLGHTRMEKMGYCLRYPPHPLRDEGTVGVPLTDMADWCGEYRPIGAKPDGENAHRLKACEQAFGTRQAMPTMKRLFPGLSVRASKCILRAVHENGSAECQTWCARDWLGVRNCGERTVKEICSALGVEAQ